MLGASPIIHAKPRKSPDLRTNSVAYVQSTGQSPCGKLSREYNEIKHLNVYGAFYFYFFADKEAIRMRDSSTIGPLFLKPSGE